MRSLFICSRSLKKEDKWSTDGEIAPRQIFPPLSWLPEQQKGKKNPVVFARSNATKMGSR